MNLNALPINVFDAGLLVVLVLGLLSGRKHGMSGELFPLLKWLLIVGVCGVAYEPLGRRLAESSPFSLLSSFLMVYVGIAVLILGVFALLKHRLGSKLVGSDVFGKSEYYLGMGSGAVRYMCILLSLLAILNARLITATEVKADEAYQNDVYGSNFFPRLHTIQSTVFDTSVTGPLIRQYAGSLLIQPTLPENKQMHQQEAKLPY